MASSSTSDSLEFHPAGWQSCSEHISWSQLGPGEDVEETKTWLWPGVHSLIQHRRQWEHFDGTEIRFGSKHSVDGASGAHDFWCFLSEFPRFLLLALRSGVCHALLPGWRARELMLKKTIGAFGHAGAVPWRPFFGKGASIPCLSQLGFCFPRLGASLWRGGGNGKRFSFPRRTCSDPPVITGDGFGHGVPLSCP